MDESAKGKVIYVNILLCLGEDAIQIWSGKSGRYNLLTFTYVNVAPHQRGKSCKTTFLAFTMNMANDCFCEQSIFSQAFMGEIEMLRKGFACEIPGLDGISRRYVIQARVVQYLLDTKGMEKRFHIQCSSSKQCTPCGMPGIHSKEAGCVIYPLYRML